MRDGVPPRPSGNLDTWALELVEWLTSRERTEEEVLPRTVLLEHQRDSRMPRAIEDGLLMFDPVRQIPVYSSGGAWTPISGMWWAGDWEPGLYYEGQVVLDNGWTMVALRDTTDRPSPFAQGDPFPVYTGSSPVGSISAPSLVVGNIYTWPQAAAITKYRIYTVTGNTYSVYFSFNGGTITEILSFTANTTGWQEFTASGIILGTGDTGAMSVRIYEPPTTPVTFDLLYNYTTPNNEAIPIPAEILHATRDIGNLRVHKTDINGDQSAQLATLQVNDRIVAVGREWIVSSITDNGTWYLFGVVPALQGAAEAAATFTFESTTVQDINTIVDTDHYASVPEVQPFYEIGTGSPVLTQDGYGIDVTVQLVALSDDWEVVAPGTTFSS